MKIIFLVSSNYKRGQGVGILLWTSQKGWETLMWTMWIQLTLWICLKSIKWVMNLEIKIPKKSWKFQKFLVSQKTTSIEASQPKWQLVDCTTLWCNSVAKHPQQMINAWFYSRCLFSPVFMGEVNMQVYTEQIPTSAKSGLHLFPDNFSKNLVLCSFKFSTDSFTNKAQFDSRIFRKIETKVDAVLTILDPPVISQYTSLSNCFITLSLLLCLLNRSFDTSSIYDI